MLKITVPENLLYNDKTNKFTHTKTTELQLEHSLVSISKWESKWKKPFLTDKYDKTEAELRDYIKCMTLTQNVDPNVYLVLSSDNIAQIKAYLNDTMTATTFYKQDKKDENSGGGRKHAETITSELIYYWMTAYQIPVEFQKWHINRLLTLVKICSIKNSDQNKMSKKESGAAQSRINKARRAKARPHK